MVSDWAKQRWSLGCVSDALSDSARFRVLCIMDDCTCEALATAVVRSMTGRCLPYEMDGLIRRSGKHDVFVTATKLR